MSNDSYLQFAKQQLNQVGPGFCLSKFYEVSMHLETGRVHSCIHPKAHLVPVEEIQNSYHALHNDLAKKNARQEMLTGQRPKECGYCWNMEDANNNIVSDRVYFSSRYPGNYLELIKEQGSTGNYFPTHLEISFSITCNLKCTYCSPMVSSRWLDDIRVHGSYPNDLYNLDYLKQNNELAIPDKEYNPYTEAFWQWLPEAYDHLWVLRVTGGEPLLSKHTYKLLDWVESNNNKNLELGINTNLNVPDQLIDTLINKLKAITDNVKSVTIWTSGESHGSKFDYIRSGGNYQQWQTNIIKILDQVPQIQVRIMTTYSALSVYGYSEFLYDMIAIKNQYPGRFILDTHTYLQYPKHLTIDILTEDYVNPISEQVEYLKKTLTNSASDQHSLFQAERLLQYFQERINNPLPNLTALRQQFYNYITEYDRRTGCNFVQEFPEMQDFFNLCNNGR